MTRNSKLVHGALGAVFLLSSLGIPGEPTAVAPPEHWRKTYRDFHELVTRLDDQVARNFFPELTLIKDGNRIATIQVDAFGARVLREADDLLLPYREGLQQCIDRQENEYRPRRTTSFEKFAWFLDRYVKTVLQAVGGGEEEIPEKGIRERVVSSDRSLYAVTRLAAAYLQERLERAKKTDTGGSAADRALEAAIDDVGRRVFRLDLTLKFDRRELVEKGAASQPVFRDLASHESGQTVSLGLDPLNALVHSEDREPPCPIALQLKQTARRE